MAIALLIRQARIKKGFSQRKLAKKIGMTTQQFQKLESPGKSNPTIKTLIAISEALDENLELKLVA